MPQVAVLAVAPAAKHPTLTGFFQPPKMVSGGFLAIHDDATFANKQLRAAQAGSHPRLETDTATSIVMCVSARVCKHV